MKIQEVTGFEWDDGNKAKCQKHGVALAEIESVFYRTLDIFPDLAHSQSEARYIAIGKTEQGRSLFIAFTLRETKSKARIRPISARFYALKRD